MVRLSAVVLAAALVGCTAPATADDPPKPAPLQVTGTLGDDGVECPALRGDDGTLYTLAGDTEDFAPGDRVRVTGRLAEVSVCMQGKTIAVEDITEARTEAR